jgi:hypothetical protein
LRSVSHTGGDTVRCEAGISFRSLPYLGEALAEETEPRSLWLRRRVGGLLNSRLAIGFLLGVSFLVCTVPASGQLYRFETDDVVIIYAGRPMEYLVPHVARSFKNSMAFHSRLFAYTPSEKPVVFLQDFSDYGSGGASAVPDNGISVNIAPFSYVYENRPANERMNWVMNHELVHVLAGDKASGRDRFFRGAFFGKVQADVEDPISMFYSYLTNPRWYAPRWYHEGIAVFMETWMAGGMGRALGPYDEMVFRTMVRDSAYIYNMVGLESEGTASDFQVGAVSYLYGTRFFNYLALKFGPETLVDWVGRTDGSKAYFTSQFKRVYGVSCGEEWSRWIEWEKMWQEANLDSIRKYPTTAYRPISKQALGSVSRAYLDRARGVLYVALLYPGESAHLAAIDLKSGEIDKVCEIQGPALYYVTSIAYDEASGTCFIAEDNNFWRDLVAVDVASGRKRTLIKDARVGDLAFNSVDRSLWGVRHYNGISTLTRIPYPYTAWDQVYSFPYGSDIFDPDVSPDGSLLTCAITKIDGTQYLMMSKTDSLLAGNPDFDVLCDFEVSSPANFVFTPDGKYLYGSSYYTGVSNIYRYDLGLDSMQVMTNCETGFFRPVPISADSLVVFRYTGEGFVPVMISTEPTEHVSAIRYLGQEVVETHPVLKDWAVTPAAVTADDSSVIRRGDYGPLRNIKLTSVYPIVQGYKAYTSFGGRLDSADRLGMAKLTLTGSYTPADSLPERERIHLGLKFRYWQWSADATYNGADFYDLFGPTKTSRKGYSWNLGYRKGLIYNPPRTAELRLHVAGFGDLETMPRYQNIRATFDRFVNFGLTLGYRNLRGTLGSVDYEKGSMLEMNSVGTYVNDQVIPRYYADFGLGHPLPIDHAPVWLWGSAGYSYGESDDSFANFYFGGFGNNWVDHQSIKRYREHYAFPGTELNEVGGTDYGKLTLEWVLPPLRFKRMGFTGAYLQWARLSLFSSGLAVNIGDKDDGRQLLDAGGQLDIRLVTCSLLESTFSVGYAVAVEENRRMSRELMVSFKML